MKFTRNSLVWTNVNVDQEMFDCYWFYILLEKNYVGHFLYVFFKFNNNIFFKYNFNQITIITCVSLTLFFALQNYQTIVWLEFVWTSKNNCMKVYYNKTFNVIPSFTQFINVSFSQIIYVLIQWNAFTPQYTKHPLTCWTWLPNKEI